VIKYNRQVSVQPLSQPKHKPRKISLPAKPGVKFCTEIQIFEIKRHWTKVLPIIYVLFI